LTVDDIPTLREQWLAKYGDVFGDIPLQLPPWREVNHEIILIDPDKRHNYHLPKCADHYREQLLQKIERYTAAGWWVPATARQAVPMLCVSKKTPGVLRTVFDLRLQNDNTVKDVTPFPDQDNIRHDVARATFRSKLDMTEAYEQVRIVEKDVSKTAFATVLGTYVSNVMQMGDCNAPSTFQRLMTHVFHEYIGRSVHVYMDDIFIFSSSIEEHEKHIGNVFQKLREQKLYLSHKENQSIQ
jgi:hypothetical protein